MPHLSSLVIDGFAVGPYFDRHHGRYSVTVYRSDGTHGSMLYSRWLMQEHLGRVLLSEEHVDHVDENRLNDDLVNLQILTPAANVAKSNRAQKGIERGWSHGTVYGFMRKNCTCEPCAQAKLQWNERRRAARRGPDVRGPYRAAGDHVHGTNSMYRRGCRCDDCREAHAQAARTLRAKGSGNGSR